jgi:hypothetical protein
MKRGNQRRTDSIEGDSGERFPAYGPGLPAAPAGSKSLSLSLAGGIILRKTYLLYASYSLPSAFSIYTDIPRQGG